MIDEDAPTRVAITGISGYLGRELAAQLDVDSSILSVIGLDIAPFVPPSPKTRFFRRSVEAPFADLFIEERVNAALHLAFATEPGHDRAHEERVNVEGTRHFLDACSKAKVKTVLVASSATAYGARADNPEVLYEGAPLRASPDLPCAHDKIRVEDLCYEFVKQNPDVCLQIVRPCLVVGPHMNNFVSRLLERPFVLLPRGMNPPLQFIHEDDVVRVLVRLLRSRKVGVFNLAADGAITVRKIAELAGRRVVRLPRFLLRWLVGLGWRLGWRWLAEAPPAYLDYITHPWVVSNIKLKSELFFLFRYPDASRAIRAYLERAVVAPPRSTHADDDDEDIDDLDELEEVDTPEPAPPPPAPAPTAADAEDEATPRLPIAAPPPARSPDPSPVAEPSATPAPVTPAPVTKPDAAPADAAPVADPAPAVAVPPPAPATVTSVDDAGTPPSAEPAPKSD